MEEKIVGEKKGSSLFSFISFTLLSIASLSSVYIHTAPALDLPPHSGSPTVCFASNVLLGTIPSVSLQHVLGLIKPPVI